MDTFMCTDVKSRMHGAYSGIIIISRHRHGLSFTKLILEKLCHRFICTLATYGS